MRLFITDPAQKELQALNKKLRERVEVALEKLLVHPQQADVRKLQGKKDFWRLRVGDLRVILRAEEDALYVMRIRHRREVYR